MTDRLHERHNMVNLPGYTVSKCLSNAPASRALTNSLEEPSLSVRLQNPRSTAPTFDLSEQIVCVRTRDPGNFQILLKRGPGNDDSEQSTVGSCSRARVANQLHISKCACDAEAIRKSKHVRSGAPQIKTGESSTGIQCIGQPSVAIRKPWCIMGRQLYPC